MEPLERILNHEAARVEELEAELKQLGEDYDRLALELRDARTEAANWRREWEREMAARLRIKARAEAAEEGLARVRRSLELAEVTIRDLQTKQVVS